MLSREETGTAFIQMSIPSLRNASVGQGADFRDPMGTHAQAYFAINLKDILYP